MPEVLTEQVSFGRYKYGYGTDGSQVRKLVWIDDGTIPIAIADFQNGAYSLNSVTRSYNDLFANPVVFGANVASIAAGEGFKNSYAGATTSATATIAASTELELAVLQAPGHTGVISVSIIGDAPAPTCVSAWTGPAGINAQAQLQTTGALVRSRPGLVAFTDSPLATPVYFNGTDNYIAYSITPTGLALSVNGSAVVTSVQQATYASLNSLSISSQVSAGATGTIARVRKATYYSLQSNTRLITLSTPP